MKSNSLLGGKLEEERLISEEMLEDSYIRAIQAQYINKKALEMKEAGMKQMNDQLFTLFNATEKLRVESMKVEEEKMYWDLLTLVGRSLRLVEGRLRPALELMASLSHQLERLGLGLEACEHHLPVKGVTLGDTQVARLQMEQVSSLLEKFNTDFAGRKGEIEERDLNLNRLRVSFEKMARDYGRCLSLLREVDTSVSSLESISKHEVSLLCSFKQLERAEQRVREEEKRELLVDFSI